jgi:RNA polymerase sigma factor (sigma-70 family)
VVTHQAFERLYRHYVGGVYRYALAVMRNPADAEDVTQATFLNAYRAYVEDGSRPAKPQSWLIAIAHDLCRQRLGQSPSVPAEAEADGAGDQSPSDDDIRRAFNRFASNQRAALLMREVEGRSYAEIAAALEVSTSAVETLIFAARRDFRELLEGLAACGEAELAISRRLDGRLGRRERRQLRSHLRECPECAAFARCQRAQRGALKMLARVTVPASLTPLFGGAGTGADERGKR